MTCRFVLIDQDSSKSMKTERISLFILAIEIVAITYLHASRNHPTAGNKGPLHVKSLAPAPINPHLSFIDFR